MKKNKSPRSSVNQEPASKIERQEKVESLEKIREKIKSDVQNDERDIAGSGDNRPDRREGPRENEAD